MLCEKGFSIEKLSSPTKLVSGSTGISTTIIYEFSVARVSYEAQEKVNTIAAIGEIPLRMLVCATIGAHGWTS